MVDTATLVCPLCKGLIEANGGLRCTRCGRVFPQPDDRWVDLIPERHREAPDGGWHERQREMERAYDELAADPAHATLAYHLDLDGYRGHLARCAGRVLDLGGGNGIVRHYLASAVDYLVLDPSTSWFYQPWANIAGEFPCLATPPAFVRGIGEYMPFPDRSFDWVLSFWSLNHLADPRAVLGEVARVLKPGGRMLISLDDVPPTWIDVLTGAYRDPRFPSKKSLLKAKLQAILRGWPIQTDHIRISERDLRAWTLSFVQEERSWIGSYLSLTLRRV
jgi:SAM-dependent methyltransferase